MQYSLDSYPAMYASASLRELQEVIYKATVCPRYADLL